MIQLFYISKHIITALQDFNAVFQYFVILLSPLPFHKNMQYYYFYIVDTAL